MSDHLRRWSSRTSTSSDGSDRTSFVKFDLTAFATDGADAEGAVDNNSSSNGNNKKAPEGPVIDLARLAATSGEVDQSTAAASVGSPKGQVSKPPPQASQSTDSLQAGISTGTIGSATHASGAPLLESGGTNHALEEAKKGSGIAIDLTGVRRAQRPSEPAPVRPSRGGQSVRSSVVSEAESEWWSTNGGLVSDPLRDSTSSMRSVQSVYAAGIVQRDQRLSTIDTLPASDRSTVRSLPAREEVSDPVPSTTSYCSSAEASAETPTAPSWTSYGTPKESPRPQGSAEVAGGRGVKGLLRSTLRKTTRGAIGKDVPNVEEQRSTKFRVKFADDQTTENEPQQNPSAGQLPTATPAKPPGSPGLNVPNPKPVASWFPHAVPATATTSSSSQWQPKPQASPKPADAAPAQQASTQKPPWATSRSQPEVEQSASQSPSSSFTQASPHGALPSGISPAPAVVSTGQSPPPSTKPLQMDMARKSSSSSSCGSQGKPVVQNVELAIMSPSARGSNSAATPLRESEHRESESNNARPAPRTRPPSGWSSPNLGMLEQQEAGAAIQGPYFDPQVCAYYSYSGKWADDVCAALRNWKTCFVCCFPPAWAMRLYTLLRRASPFDVRCPCCGGQTTVTVTTANSCIFAFLVMVSTAPSVVLAVLAFINPPPKAYVELLDSAFGKAAAPVVKAMEVVLCVLLAWLVTGLLWAWMLLSVGRKFHIGKAVSRCGSFMCEACCCPCIVNVRAGMHVDRTQGFLPVQESVRRIIELTTKVQKWEERLSSVRSSSEAGPVPNPVSLEDGDDTEILLGLADLEEKRRKRSIMSVGSTHAWRH